MVEYVIIDPVKLYFLSAVVTQEYPFCNFEGWLQLKGYHDRTQIMQSSRAKVKRLKVRRNTYE